MNVDLTNFGKLSNLKISPNPAQNGTFTLYLPENESETVTMTLYNSAGRTVRTSTLPNRQTEIEINVAELVKGMYVIRVDMDRLTSWDRLILY